MEDKKREEMLAKAMERGYEVIAFASDYNWHSLYNQKLRINLELYVESGDFVLNHMVPASIIQITTGKCGSFMSDKHFDGIERQIRRVLFDLL